MLYYMYNLILFVNISNTDNWSLHLFAVLISCPPLFPNSVKLYAKCNFYNKACMIKSFNFLS